jgi:metallo-beta-lactamase class B
MSMRTSLIVFCLVAASAFAHADDASYAEIIRISPRVWVHKSYVTINGSRVDSNGMIVDLPNGVVLADTCWNDAQTRTLLKQIEDTFHKPVLLAVITHAHDDRIGGIRALLEKGIKAVCTPLTKQKAIAAGYPAPLPDLNADVTALSFGGFSIEVFHPGAGHTEDNITVWVPSDKVLLGACLIKSAEAGNLGNTADAVIPEWAPSVRRLISRYPDASIVIPGHGKWGGPELLRHTIELCPRD